VFRGLIQSYLRQFWSTVWHWGTLVIPVAGLITAVIFGLGHINFTLVPLAITHFDLLQVSGAFFFGLCYAVFYQRTGSLVAPMLLHSLGNVVTLAMVYLRVLAL